MRGVHLRGGGFKHVLFSPLFGEDEPILANPYESKPFPRVVFSGIQSHPQDISG